jgi:hypothetical protein
VKAGRQETSASSHGYGQRDRNKAQRTTAVKRREATRTVATVHKVVYAIKVLFTKRNETHERNRNWNTLPIIDDLISSLLKLEI